MPNSVLLAGTPAVPVIEQIPRPGIRGMWFHAAANGHVWPLLDTTYPVFLGQSAGGLHMPEEEEFVRSSALPGQFYGGGRAKPRKVQWDLNVNANQFGFRAWDSSLWWHLQRGGAWEVRTDVGSRFLDVRLVWAPHEYDRDPIADGWVTYPVELVADQPFWRSADQSVTFKNTAARMFGGTRAEPWLWVSGSTTGGTVVENPGDVPAWPVWRFTGPLDAVAVSLDGHQVVVNTPIADGQWVELDTRPHSARGRGLFNQSGTNVTRTLGVAAFDLAAVPAGGSAGVAITHTGAGAVSVTVTPMHNRAW